MSDFTYKYARPAVTTDVVIFRQAHADLEVLLIKRKHPPFENCWALPGGFVDENETSEQGAARELLEETGCVADTLKLVGVFDTPNRDPRGWTISIAYKGQVPFGTQHTAGDDASETAWVSVNRLPQNLAFDHRQILTEAILPKYSSICSAHQTPREGCAACHAFGSIDYPFAGIQAPDGYRLLNEGEMIQEGDLFWTHECQWEFCKNTDKTPFEPWSKSFRPVVSEIK